MHSCRMRTVRNSSHLLRRVPGPGGWGAWSWRVPAPRGVGGAWSWGVPALGGCLVRAGCLVLGGPALGGVPGPRGRGCVYPSMH